MWLDCRQEMDSWPTLFIKNGKIFRIFSERLFDDRA